MRQGWEPEDLIEVWTLLEDDMKKVWNKSGATRLGFALLLKFFEVEARFPESAGEVPAAAVEYVAQQVKVSARPRIFSQASLGVPVVIGVRFWLTAWLLGLRGADSGGARHADDLEYSIP
ncbi:hypothetical protein MBT84_38595 [Streptomyces sp. MBT84]|uniref:DUF4158 domain-containing protein n=1 Tax=Streptomyces sp. MBT84 TaxID=1488414 RepID=UPI001C6E4AAD|nr:DUF4158 domain-containing protein [Streptomyces sp. MBT84]MBW8705531.1 hypothetical protein [Streptomyces sp. MBT84]